MIAVVTSDPKTYFLAVKHLKEFKFPFLSLIPGENIPSNVSVILSDEENLIQNHRKIVKITRSMAEKDFKKKIIDAICILRTGKEHFENLFIGVDPGPNFGVAILADGDCLETYKNSSLKEILDFINISVEIYPAGNKIIRIGTGATSHQRKLVEGLLETLSESQTHLELVDETKTRPSKRMDGIKNKHIRSAMKIAVREGKEITLPLERRKEHKNLE